MSDSDDYSILEGSEQVPEDAYDDTDLFDTFDPKDVNWWKQFLFLHVLMPLINLLPTCCLHPKTHCTPKGQLRLFLKYFCAGQIKSQSDEGMVVEDDDKKEDPPLFKNSFYVRFIHRRPHWVTWVLPLITVNIVWLTIMCAFDLWWIFDSDKSETPGWTMTLVMLAGSFVAGATSEGGGSVAFPVLTLGFGIPPAIARNFSLMIQSVGMTAAAFAIFYTGIIVEKTAILWGSIGAGFGIIIGLSWIGPNLPPAFSKIAFVSVWFAFAINLFVLNRVKKRTTFLTLGKKVKHWQRAALFWGGFVGGILSAISGSGVDICMFSVLTLLFRVTEKTATPTSVIMMAINTCIGFWFVGFVDDSIDQESWIYFGCCVPIVVFGAPFGAFVSSFLHRQVLAWFVYFTDTFQFIAALIIVEMTGALWGLCIGLVSFGVATFAFMAIVGQIYLFWRLRKIRQRTRAKVAEQLLKPLVDEGDMGDGAELELVDPRVDSKSLEKSVSPEQTDSSSESSSEV